MIADVTKQLPQPRERPKPSPRNMQIYELVRVQHEPQEQVAARFGINQQRVSQICRQVEAWRQWLETAPDFETRAADERRRVLLAARLREERLLLLALQRAVEPAETLVTERTMTSSEGTKVDRYEKVLPANPAWLKCAAQSARRITRLGERLGIDVETSDVTEQIDELLRQIAASSAELNEGITSSTTSNDQTELGPDERPVCFGSNGAPVAAATCGEGRALIKSGGPSKFLSAAGTSERSETTGDSFHGSRFGGSDCRGAETPAGDSGGAVPHVRVLAPTSGGAGALGSRD